MDIPDRIIISGLSGGLGRKLAEAFPADKILGINNKNFVLGAEYEQVLCDISRYMNVPVVLDEYVKKFYSQKIAFILAAGTLGTPGGIVDSDLRDWEQTICTNLFGNLAILKAFIPNMLFTGYARIILLSGGGAAYGYPLFSGYSLSKVAIVREAENIHEEIGSKINDFSIIALAPGAMETDMLKKVKEAGGKVRTTVDISETVGFIKNYIEMDYVKAARLSGKFIHVRDDLNSEILKDKWMLRRIE